MHGLASTARARIGALLALAAVVAAAGVAALAPANAGAALAVGMGEEMPTMFSSPLFTDLGLQRVRYVAPYDVARTNGAALQDADAFLRTARAGGYQVLVSFAGSAMPGRAGQLPTVAQYTDGVRAFMKRYPFVRAFSPWDEVNTCSEPTCRDPRAVARYYRALVGACRGCTVLGAEVLDTDYREMRRYLQAFMRYVGRPLPRIWGLHNYSDVNRFRTVGTRTMLSTVPGQVWLTEVGGLYSFGSSFPPSASRQARATRWMFKLATSSPRIARLYIYSWSGGGTFDAGLMAPSGNPRPAYQVVASTLRRLR